MHGATFGAIVLFVVMLAAGVFMSPLFLIPAVLLIGAALFAGPLGAMIKGGNGPAGSAGATPSTSEASYDPVSTPGGPGAA